MIYFYTFNIFVLMILFNFLLAIICDAFGEVKANASESVSVTTELAPMMRDVVAQHVPLHVPEPRPRRARAAPAQDLDGRESRRQRGG